MKRLPPEVARRHHFFFDWWREISGRVDHGFERSRSGRFFRILRLWLPVAAVFFVLASAAALYLYTGWRAKDLAHRARLSIREGDLRYAFIQAQSARSLRGNDPDVLRSFAAAQAALGDASSLQTWDRIAAIQPLNADDLNEKTGVAAKLGNDEQFNTAVAMLEESGQLAEVDAWRGRRALLLRDFSAAEKHLRAAAEKSRSPQSVLELAELLVTIGTKESLAEATALVDRMAEGPDSGLALAFALSRLPAGRATRHAWATRAMGDASADNEALLPAATVLINDRLRTVEEVTAEMDPIFVDAPLERRGLYARWLLDRQRPGDALSFIYPGEARGSRGAFLIRAEALSAVEDWEGLKDLVDAGSPVNEPVTFLLKGRADSNLGRAAAASHLERAIRASLPRMILPEVLREVDNINRQNLADQVLLELCGEPATADYALRVARWRFSQRGEPRLRDEAFRRALTAAPQAATVEDLARQQRLLRKERVDPAETDAALRKERANIDFRLTHALALLVDGRGAEARKILGPVEAVRHQLLPAQKVIVVAALAATGSRSEAVDLARTMNSAHLTDAEYRIVYEQTLAAASSAIKDPRKQVEGE